MTALMLTEVSLQLERSVALVTLVLLSLSVDFLMTAIAAFVTKCFATLFTHTALAFDVNV